MSGSESRLSTARGALSRQADDCVRVLICGGNPLIRAGLRSVLQGPNGFELVGEVAESRYVEVGGAAPMADVIVLDAAMFTGDPVRVVRRLTKRDGDASAGVVVLLDHGEDEQVLDYLRAGARGLLFRDGPVDEIVDVVSAVARGDVFIAPPVARYVVDALLRYLPPVTGPRPKPLECLTRREHEVYGMLKAGMSNAEIAEALSLSEKTIKFHVSNVLQKLGLRSRVHAIVYGTFTQVHPGIGGPAPVRPSAPDADCSCSALQPRPG
jgi:DNA-binding NarL/FixJ family response regulator